MNNQHTRNLYLIPYVLWIVLFVVAPILLIVYYSFFDIEGTVHYRQLCEIFHPCLYENDLEFFLVCFFDYLFFIVNRLSNGFSINQNKTQAAMAFADYFAIMD